MSPSPARPPGFEASPTPPLLSSGPVQRTPSPPRHQQLERVFAGLEPLFVTAQAPLLPSPVSPPRVPVTARRKTLAGVKICTNGGLALRRSSARTKASERQAKTSLAKQAEAAICRNLGIVEDGQDITEKAIDAFAAKFKDQLSDDVLGAMRAFFRLDDAQYREAEDGLINHGGEGALDHDDGVAAAATT